MTNTSELLADERSLFEIADKAYFKATETSDPQHWMEAALFARQHRNVLTKLRPSLPSDVGGRSDMAMLAGKRSIPDIRGMSGSIGEARCLKLWFARNVTDDDRAWLLQAINEKMHREETAALRQSTPSPGEQKLGSSEPLGPLYDGTTMDNQQLHGTTRRNQPVVTVGETATPPSTGQQDEREAIAGSEFYLVPREIIDRFPEININNYDHDDACTLNAWGCDVVTNSNPASPALAAVEQAPGGVERSDAK